MNNQITPPPPVDPRFVHLLTRWESEVRSLEKQGWEAQKVAADFGKLGLNSALLLNGGALVALPPLMQWLSPVARSEAPFEALWFLSGVLLTAIAIVLAYVNWMFGKEQQYLQARIRGRELDCEFIGKPVKSDSDYVAATKMAPVINTKIAGTQIGAVLAAFAAYVVFGIGVYSFMALVGEYAVPTQSPRAHISAPDNPKTTHL